MGFRPHEYTFLDGGGLHFLRWELMEVSAVTVPANAECTIRTIKSYDRPFSAASGNRKPVVKIASSAGAAAQSTTVFHKEKTIMNIGEQIKSFENKRAALAASLEEVMTKAAEEGRTLDVEEEEHYDNTAATYGEPEGNLLTGPWQPRVSYRKQWARWRVMILPILLILVALAVERGVTLWSVSEQVAQSRTQAEKQFLTLFPEQKRIVNLRSQVTMALKKYRPQADDTRLLAELSAIASTLKSASLTDIEMRGFTFDQKRQTLHLQLRAANFASFDKLRSALAADYVVQQDALQKEGDAVSGGVTLRRK